MNKEIDIYLPPSYEINGNKKYHVLYFLNDDRYLNYARVPNTLDNLIAEDKIKETIAVFINNKDKKKGLGQITSISKEFFINLLIPYLEQYYPVLTTAKGRTIIAAAVDAKLATNIAFKESDLIGNLILQSAKLDETDFKLLEEGRNQDLKVYLDWGKFDVEGIPLVNLEFVHTLQRSNYQYYARVNSDGHHWANWREHIYHPLEYILGGQDKLPSSTLVINEEFDNKLPNYFSEKDNQRIVAQVEEGKYKLHFKERDFIKFKKYKFKEFELATDFELLSGEPFGFFLSGKVGYFLIISPKDQLFQVIDTQGNKIYQGDISQFNTIQSCRVKLKDDRLIVYINDKLLEEIYFKNNDSRYLALFGDKGAKINFKRIYIKEKL